VVGRERVRRHVAIIEKQHGTDGVSRQLPNDWRADGGEAGGTGTGNQQAADQRCVAELGWQSTDEIGAEVAERRRHVGWTLQGDEASRELEDRVRISAREREHKEPDHTPAAHARRTRGPHTLAAALGPRLVCGMNREPLVTLPNAVSMSRLLLAGAFVLVHDPVFRFAVLLTASGTDFLDGWLARRQGATTKSGALIDPIADRLFVLTAVTTYVVEDAITTGAYFILLSRDIATLIGFLVARSVPWLRAVVFRARLLGKLVTALQLLTLMAVIATPTIVPSLVRVVGAASAASIADYTLALWRERAT